MSADQETNQIIRTVKEIFMKNTGNAKQLSLLIDKYFIPQELEKKSNAEVSTPFQLRQEMLDKIPPEFWTEPRKVFEPCSGKGGFLIDIIDRFMIGLKDSIPDEKTRYKTIVEECLYFSDINPTNIFIGKLLIDPYNEYQTHANEGNTLELNIGETWGLEGFDAVIGNPPYQGSGRKKLYITFIQYSLKQILNKNGILLFITPKIAIQYLLGTQISQQKIDTLYNIKYINASNDIKTKYFKNIGSDFSYYLIENSQYNNETTVIYENNETKNIVLDYNTILSLQNYNQNNNKLINKLIKNNCNSWGRKSARIDKDLSDIQNEKYNNKIIYKIKTNSIEYKYTDKTHKDFNKYKVFYPTLGNNYIIDVEKNLFPGTSFVVYIPCVDLKECNNILYLKDSKLFKYLIRCFETQRSPIDYIWRNLVKNDVFNIDIKEDVDIYKYFIITEDEIKLIESVI